MIYFKTAKEMFDYWGKAIIENEIRDRELKKIVGEWR